MIIKIETLISMKAFSGISAEVLATKMEGIEAIIRSHTNNKFQNRAMRIEATIKEGKIIGYCPYYEVGDTLEISQTIVNDGLYVITEINENKIAVDKKIYDYAANLITKVVYPADVQKGALDLLLWEIENRAKVGVKAETISRHSITYFDQDASNQIDGYPVSLLGFLNPYRKPRF
jgi:hypothetical protein